MMMRAVLKLIFDAADIMLVYLNHFSVGLAGTELMSGLHYLPLKISLHEVYNV